MTKVERFKETDLEPGDLKPCQNYDQLGREGLTVAKWFHRLTQGGPEIAPYNWYFNQIMLGLIDQIREADYLPLNADVVDFACGDGKFLNLLLAKCPDLNAIGFDLSEEMIAIARQETGNKAGFAQMDMVEAAAMLASQDPGKLDMATCTNGVHYLDMDRLALFYQRVFKALKPGGQFIICTGDDESTASWREMTVQELENRALNGNRQDSWSMPAEDGQVAFRMSFNIQLIEEHEILLNEAGFEVETLRQVPPLEELKDFNPGVYEDLTNNKVFVFFVAKKESR